MSLLTSPPNMARRSPFEVLRRRLATMLLVVCASMGWCVPAEAKSKLKVKFPSSSIAGTPITVSGIAPKSAKAASVRLERRTAPRRWEAVAKAPTAAKVKFALSFVPSAKKQSVTLRVRITRNGKTLASSATQTIKLLARPVPLSGPILFPPATVQAPQPSLVPPTTPPPAIPPPTSSSVMRLVGPAVELSPGASVAISTPPALERISTLALDSGLAGVSLRAVEGTFELSAGVAVSPRPLAELRFSGTGCTALGCDQAFELEVPLLIREVEAPRGRALEAITSPSPDRVASGLKVRDGVVDLVDQLNVTFGTPDVVGTRAEADAIAASVGAVVTGGIEAVGMFEFRWPSTQDLDARTAELLGKPGVTGVSRATPGIVEAAASPPGDWDDDRANLEVMWSFDQVRAQRAWDITTGGDTRVGIVDGGLVYGDHEDLEVVKQVGGGSEADHATHVAGLACAKANGKGVVGMAWGCPIVSSGIKDSQASSVLEAATKVAGERPKVINLSLGYKDGNFCHTAAQQAALVRRAESDKQSFRNLFQGPLGRGIVWTIAAGNNCADGVPSPWGLNSDLANVITVAATNSDKSLASFSDFGSNVDVAAPGGVSPGDLGMWSTLPKSCGIGGWFLCSHYGRMAGTSMSAPLVAGVAALVRSANPSIGAAEAAECIESSAGIAVGRVSEHSNAPSSRTKIVEFDPSTQSIPIVNAEAAVQCETFDSTRAAAYTGSWDNGSWTLSIAEESPGVLGIVNQQPTYFTGGGGSGCYGPTGLKILRGASLQESGEWHGLIVRAYGGCSSFRFESPATLRAVRNSDGAIELVMAWPTSAGGARPTITAEGSIVSATAYNSTRLRRPVAGSIDRSLGRFKQEPRGLPSAASGVLAEPVPRP